MRDSSVDYSHNLKSYLQEFSEEYDVVEYEHFLLPFERSLFPSKTLFVARASLLAHHYLRIRLPKPTYWLDRVRKAIRPGVLHPSLVKAGVAQAQKTIEEADLVNVANRQDFQVLVESGIPENKILVQPYGLSEQSIRKLGALDANRKTSPRVAFIGTFDVRKGASEMPAIIDQLVQEIPGVCFRLLGTAAEFQTAEDVLKRLPQKHRSKIEVIPHYQSEQLPSLLEDCAVGLFPSYLESFGFAALEMMMASLPVAAYRAPGPSDFMPSDWLVQSGDSKGLVSLLSRWLKDPVFLENERRRASTLAKTLTWEKVAISTSLLYKKAIEEKFSQI
ncbi:MAG: glycosyltransferase [Verrucomicrobiota bacterium]